MSEGTWISHHATLLPAKGMHKMSQMLQSGCTTTCPAVSGILNRSVTDPGELKYPLFPSSLRFYSGRQGIEAMERSTLQAVTKGNAFVTACKVIRSMASIPRPEHHQAGGAFVGGAKKRVTLY